MIGNFSLKAMDIELTLFLIKQKRLEFDMGKYYKKTEFEILVNTLAEAVKNFNLVVFVGAGTSLSQGYPNWNGYIDKLIHFWQFNIRNFPEAEGKISNQLLSQFDEILESRNTNKRKIDLLHTLLRGVLGKKFDDVKLDFEEYFFNSVAPDFVENSVLVELAKLDPIFVTSNYDFEIERHLGRSKQKGAFKPINNIREFTELNSILRSGDVLHLHGTTEGDWNFFVNSSVDYSRQYLKQPQDFNNLSTWFKENNPVVLFIGSSMEEEEILSLLPATTQNFALMKADSGETQGFREIYNQTYQKNNNTTIFWYGDNYNELPVEVNKIVGAVQNKLEIPESIDDWNILHAVSTEDEVYKEILEKHSEDESFLFDIFKADDFDLEKKILKNTLSSQILLDKSSGISSFWTMIDKKFATLDEIQVQSIIKIFIKQKLSIHWEEIFKVFENLKQSSKIEQEDIDEIRRNLSENKELVRTDFSSDSYLMGYWLVKQLQQGHPYHRSIFYKDKVFSINLKSEMISLITESVTDEFGYRYLSFKELMSDDLMKIIYNSLLNGRLLLDGISILDNFPDSLLELRLFQRILVSLDNENSLHDSVVTNLISKIDFSDTIFGAELNVFVDKHRKEIEKFGTKIPENYQNGMDEGEAGIVYPKSFIDNNQILEEDVDSILRILLTSQSESFLTRKDFYSERTSQATSDFLISSLNRDDEVSKKVKKLILEKGLLLYPKYEKLFIEILTNDYYDSELKTESLKIFLKKFDMDSFSWEEEKLFQGLIDKEEFESPAFQKLLKVNVDELNYDYVYTDKDRPELLEVDDFINTELGRYLSILIKLNKKDHSRRSKIKSIVSSVTPNEFREYSQGALFTVDSSIDLEEITINTFQGYSFSISGFKEKDLAKFKPAGQELLKKGYVNNLNQNNLFLLALCKINPSDEKTEVNWSEVNFSWLIVIILRSNVEFEYESQWTKEIILNDTDGKYGMNILHSLAEENALLAKAEKFFQIFEECINDYEGKVSIESLPDSIEEQSDPDKKNLLIKLIFLLLDNAKIEKSYFGSKSLVDLMKQLPLDLQKRLAGHTNLSTILSPLEIENLKREID